MIDIKAIKARYEAATKGEWTTKHYLPSHPVNNKTNSWYTDVICKGKQVCRFLDLRMDRAHDDPGEAPNAEFIIHSRQDIPDLIKEIEWLREAAKAYQDLAACYRLSKRPSEKLFVQLDKARQALKGNQ